MNWKAFAKLTALVAFILYLFPAVLLLGWSAGTLGTAIRDIFGGRDIVNAIGQGFLAIGCTVVILALGYALNRASRGVTKEFRRSLGSSAGKF